MKKLAVAALGGNALSKGNEIGTIDQQERNAYDTCRSLIELIKDDYNLVITHGNGPQVGNILLRNQAGYDVYKIPKMPLDICVADSQGGIGYMIERQMKNALAEQGIERNVITIVTQVLVDINDPAFKSPSKPVGGFYLKEEADLLAKANGWVYKEDPRKRGWRRVVASPNPVEIVNKDIIKRLAEEGNIIIAVGGGGIPVYKDGSGKLNGIEAVIDKDLASSLLANEIKADNFYILTDVSKVFIRFNTKEQKALDVATVEQLKDFYRQGEFAAGSMGPKILAALSFVEQSGSEAVIAHANELSDKNNGTRIIK